MKTLLALSALLIAPFVFAQDCPKDDSVSPKEPKMDRPERKGPKMTPEQRSAHHAEMIKKFDKDGDGKLSEEEKTAMKSERKEKGKNRRAEMIKKFDKDGDGKLSEEEKTATRKEMKKHGKAHRLMSPSSATENDESDKG